MDSLTQFVLGAGVGAVFLAPKIGARKAVVLGGVLGTLPDLDTFLPAADVVDAFVSHRGASHSIIVHALVTPLLGEAVLRIFKGLKRERLRVYAAVFLILATHALIDAMTIYGTRILWPLVQDPLGVGSIFIIDPIYTLPLLIMSLWALFAGGWSDRLRRASYGALALSSAYLLLTLGLQAHMTGRAEGLLKSAGVTPERLLVIPTPLNTLYWKAIAIDGGRYINIYLPLFGDDAQVYSHARRDDLVECLANVRAFDQLARFSDGFYGLEVTDDGRIVYSDLRMGLTPGYVFRFALARSSAEGVDLLDPPERVEVVRSSEGDWDWLLAGLQQRPIARLAEEERLLALADLAPRERELAALACQSQVG